MDNDNKELRTKRDEVAALVMLDALLTGAGYMMMYKTDNGDIGYKYISHDNIILKNEVKNGE